MAKRTQVPFTEPVIIPCLFVSGIATEFMPTFVRIIGWVELPSLPNEPHEKRIISRLVLPTDVARELVAALQNGLPARPNN
ncbi:MULTISPECIES: hypothetical protein [unclassified Mesorhizobium]|uniref:hypothetical protein n=1 Tax=unclassified Mesorhizobium TaxID=325217 RepID=UPI000FCB72EA|nr:MULTISPECIES: hypothetical protein [unclassified Mesorhizobium]TGP22333.1 hypothetical protein EN874_019675 [Mesorhizobium sp. M1D.F.Ca.ET.231.01.1.1]TGP24697.1 hypothetical protein EN877_30520 [Mesorhizobium sp. M1D.F.Ca.ET.234.01.1.1]TGS37300.1 hypothetical protein EN827_30825 [Mesorhizobium sp. M1D.F.Ca.ET.184.01.1.1]TGS58100.1 hypothetical protein EN826_030800 [Mesorhizobium sp. M1D.F.Ca.ET.183.01.1.1]